MTSPFIRQDGPSGNEKPTRLRVADGAFDTGGDATTELASVDVPEGSAVFIVAVLSGRNVNDGNSFAMHIATCFENTSGVLSEIAPDDGSAAPSYKAREDVNVDVVFTTADKKHGDQAASVGVQLTGTRLAGRFHVEVL